MFLLGEVERGAVVAVDLGLRIVHHIGNDNHVGGRQYGDTALRNKSGFLWNSQVMLCRHSKVYVE